MVPWRCFSTERLSNEQSKMKIEFTEMLPKLRKRVGMSQTKLGNKIGLSRQTISSIERKAVPLTWDKLLAMSLVFLSNDEGVYSSFEHKEYFQNVVKMMKVD